MEKKLLQHSTSGVSAYNSHEKARPISLPLPCMMMMMMMMMMMKRNPVVAPG